MGKTGLRRGAIAAHNALKKYVVELQNYKRQFDSKYEGVPKYYLIFLSHSTLGKAAKSEEHYKLYTKFVVDTNQIVNKITQTSF